MDFLGIGPLELIVVLVIALIVVGPERLPELARSVGKTMRDIRAMSQGLMAEWQREIESVAEVDPGEDLRKTLTTPFKEVQADFQQAVRAPLTSPSDARGKPSAPEPSPPEAKGELSLPESSPPEANGELSSPEPSPPEANGELSSPEPSPPEESDSKGDNSDHGDN
jgi:sec-independent protein translocase protein TatB